MERDLLLVTSAQSNDEDEYATKEHGSYSHLL